MRAKWLLSSWAYLTLSLLIALELLFIAFNVYFIFPKFSGLLAAGFIDGEFLRKPGGSWMLTRVTACASTSPLQCLNHRVVEAGAKLFDGLIGAVRPSAVAEQGHRELAFGVDPQRGSGIAQMSK